MTHAARVADLRACEALLRCFHRELAVPSGTARRVSDDRGEGRVELHVALTTLRCELRAAIDRESCTGGFEIAGPVRVAPLDVDRDDERVLDAMQLARLLVQETAARFHVAPSPELEVLVRSSRDVTRALLEKTARRAHGTMGSEQSLVFGHPFHPSPKARLGFDDDDLARYSPELGASFRLHGVAVRGDEESLDGVPFAAHLAEASGAKVDVAPGWMLLPVHPWQAQAVSQRDLGPIGAPVFATSSVRTVVRPSARCALKLPIDVRITNCVRRMSKRELRACLQVTRWMREERAGLAAITSAFGVLDEIAWAASRDRDDDGVLVRDMRPIVDAPPGDEPLVAAALFGDRDAGRERLAHLLPRSASAREAWFQGYVDALVPPTLHLFFRAGLMFEPHLQNVLVSGFAPGAPVRVLLRDFDNAKVVDGLFDRARLDRIAPDLRLELVDGFDRTWERFVYCLFVNDLAEVAAALAEGDARLEARLWSTVHASVASFRARETSTHVRRVLAELLHRPTLPAKANFLTRLFDRDDRHAPFVGVPNPLAAVSRAARRAPVARGADATWQ